MMGVAERFQPVGQHHEELHAFLKTARDVEPVFFWEPQGVWVVTRYADVTKVLGDAAHFSAEGNLSLMNADPEAERILATGIDWNKLPQVNGAEGATHKRLRDVMQNILTPRRFREMEPAIRANVNRLIDTFIADGQCDFAAQFAYPLPVYVIFDVIGFRPEEEDLAQIQKWSDDTFKLWLLPMSGDEQVACAKNAVQYQNYMKAKIADRRINPRDDLLTEFVREVDAGDGRLSEEELTIMFPMNLIGAGHETTKASLSNALYLVLSNPDRWASILADPSTIPSFVEESLRWDGPVFAWYRTVINPIELGGKAMMPGDKVVAVLASANHDERKFDDPESFCPARGNRPAHLSFSFGRHFCVGAPLARMEIAIAIEIIAQRLPGLRLAFDGPVELEPSFATRVIKSLPIAWDVAARA